ncbi:MAG: hypothetical protein GC136_04765 [Alphaproteobacteria bacterium]|nr:hypothetical protein [Alphaproteobacteria bacterium]
MQFPPVGERTVSSGKTTLAGKLKNAFTAAARTTGRLLNAAACAGVVGGGGYLMTEFAGLDNFIYFAGAGAFFFTSHIVGFAKAAVGGSLNPIKHSLEFASDSNVRPATVIAGLFATIALLTTASHAERISTEQAARNTARQEAIIKNEERLIELTQSNSQDLPRQEEVALLDEPAALETAELTAQPTLPVGVEISPRISQQTAIVTPQTDWQRPIILFSETIEAAPEPEEMPEPFIINWPPLGAAPQQLHPVQ